MGNWTMHRAIALAAGLAFMPLICCSGAFALNPALDTSQYGHTSWKNRDGFAKGRIGAIAQTSDGYLWLGTEFGLLRFDGVRPLPWEPPGARHLPDDFIRALLGTRDGSLWIGTLKGLAKWKDGKLTVYPELAGHMVDALLEDRDGTIWVGAGGFDPYQGGRVCAIRGDLIECHGEDGSLGRYVGALLEDSKGNVWSAGTTGLWRWKPGAVGVYAHLRDTSPQTLVETDDHAILAIQSVGNMNELTRIVGGNSSAYSIPVEKGARALDPTRLFRDRDGGLWIGTFETGLVHIHDGKTDVFSKTDGLSSDAVQHIFEDREGNVWVGTSDGLDRFREFAIATLDAKQGLLSSTVNSVLAGRDGSVWVATAGGVDRWKDGRIAVESASTRNSSGKSGALYAAALFQDAQGRVWVATNDGLGYLSGGQFVALRSSFPGGSVHSIVQDTAGNLWIAQEPAGLFRVSAESNAVQQIPWSKLGPKGIATSLLADPRQGGLWIGFGLDGISYFKDGQIQQSYGTRDGLGEGRVNQIRLDPDGTIWAATQGGLSRLKGGKIATLSSKNGLPCDIVHWSMEDDDHSVWLYMSCGLVRIIRGLDHWSASVDSGKGTNNLIEAQLLDNSGGVALLAYSVGFSPQVTKSSDGRLWFLPGEGLSVVDPHYLPFNKMPPPVHIEQITADHQTYDASNGLRLPPLVRDLQIDYTALSLVAPERNRFRVMLEGYDRDWQDMGNRRQVFYGSLPPRTYRFHVIASNNSSVWNETGDYLNFSIAPAYYQTNWFRASCVVTFLGLLWTLFEIRRRQLQHQFEMSLDARLSERTRIARELHDTLLQSFQGLLLRFQAAANLLPASPEQAKQKLDGAIDLTALAITEGRDAVQGLRRTTLVPTPLALAINALGHELTGGANESSAAFHVEVEGTPRLLHAETRDEVYRIAAEGMRNAFEHAQARNVEVEIIYGKRRFRLCVRDDGKGIDSTLMSAEGRPGHFGLHGMGERATAIGGQLDVWSQTGSGTEVELSLPASKAYVDRAGPFFGVLGRLLAKLSGKETATRT